MRKTVSFVGLLLTIPLALAFAGGAQSGSSGASAGKTRIRFTEWDGGSTLDTYNQIARAFNSSQDRIEVEVINIPTDYDSKIMAMIAAGDAPEIGCMSSDTLLYPLADEGEILNLADLIKADSSFDKTQLIDSLMYWKDANYLAGYSIGAEMQGLFYNPDMFKKYGVAEPPAKYANTWDWDTFVNAAQRLTIDTRGNNALSPNFDPNSIATYGINFGKWFVTYYALYHSTDGPIISADGKTLGLFTPDGIDVMQKLADLIHKYHVSPTPTASAGLPGGTEAFLSGKVAMAFDGHWVNYDFMNDDVTYNVAALPKIKTPASIAVAGALCIMNTPKKDAAWDFFKYMLKTGAVKPLEETGLWLPVTKDGLSDAYLKTIISSKHPSNYYDAFCAPMIDGTAKRTVAGELANFSRINDEFNGMLDPLWSGEKTYQQLVNENGARINALLQGERKVGKL
jgi:multiple sugar transport system substrate-binding protein